MDKGKPITGNRIPKRIPVNETKDRTGQYLFPFTTDKATEHVVNGDHIVGIHSGLPWSDIMVVLDDGNVYRMKADDVVTCLKEYVYNGLGNLLTKPENKAKY